MIQTFGVGCRLNRREYRLAVFESKIPVIRKGLIRRSRSRLQLIAKLRDERLGSGCDAGLLAIAGQLSFDLLPGQQLEAVIPELVSFGNAQVSRLQIVGDLRHDAQFKKS